jgi:hypothetical protein
MGFMNARRLIVTASGSPRGRRVLLAAVAGLALACATGFAGTAQAAESCKNATVDKVPVNNEALRAEARSTQLPQCRAYEMVSPVDTADSAVGQFPGGNGPAPSGEAAAFASPGAFADAQSGSDFLGLNFYVARRVENVGWKTSWIGAPGAVQGGAGGVTFSFDLSKVLVRIRIIQGEGPTFLEIPSLFLSEGLASVPPSVSKDLSAYLELPFDTFGGHKGAEDESPDFSHVVVSEESTLTGREHELYELAGVGGPAEVLRLVGIKPNEEVINATVGGSHVKGSKFHAISNDGAEIFFTEWDGSASDVRVNGSTTLELGGGLFQGASEDGSKVFLQGAGGELYVDVIDSEPGHEAVTETVPIAPAGQSNTYLRSSDDGSHVYFLSTGVLAGNENENKEKAEEGKENLYVYDTVTRKTAFIAQARPGGYNISGGEVEAQVNGCPSRELGEPEEPGCEAGRFFVFTTTAKITPDDTGGVAQVFEYDASSGRLTRISTGEGGYANNGNDGFAASITIPYLFTNTSENQTELFGDGSRAVSDDGSTVVFTTAGPLSPRAINGQPDVYESHEGRVSLISTGGSLTPDEHPVVTPSGRDIFFLTTAGILPQDSDGLESLYDARIGGGFPAALVPAGGCNGDSCQGPPSVPDLLGAPASATFSGLGNPVPAASTPAVKSKAKPKPKKCKKGFVRKRGRCVKRPKAKKAGNDRRIKR